MATIEIRGWKTDFIPHNAWAEHARPKLKRRLRRSINASPSEIKNLIRQIEARQPATLHQVKDESVRDLVQILDAIGAELSVSLAGVNMRTAMKGRPRSPRW